VVHLQVKHIRDKFHKLLQLGFDATTGPALLMDLIILHKTLGPQASGLSGNVIDQTDSSQNNARAEEIASLHVVHALVRHVPMSKGTALFCLLSSAHLIAFKDRAEDPPISPMARISHLSFLLCWQVFHVVALKTAHLPDVGMSQFLHSVAANEFSAQTRQVMCHALASIMVACKSQTVDHDSAKAVRPLVPQEMGSQHCEEMFSFGRSPNQQNTGSFSAGVPSSPSCATPCMCRWLVDLLFFDDAVVSARKGIWCDVQVQACLENKNTVLLVFKLFMLKLNHKTLHAQGNLV
jgi:hypothetical protein